MAYSGVSRRVALDLSPASGLEPLGPAVLGGGSDCSQGCEVVIQLLTKLRSPTARASPATARSAHSEGFRAGHCRVPRASVRHRRGHVHAPDLAPDHDRVWIHVAPFRLAAAYVAPRRSRTCGPAPASAASARRRTVSTPAARRPDSLAGQTGFGTSEGNRGHAGTDRPACRKRG